MFKRFILWLAIKIWGNSNGLLIVLWQNDLDKEGEYIHCNISTKDESYLDWRFVAEVFDTYSKKLKEADKRKKLDNEELI